MKINTQINLNSILYREKTNYHPDSEINPNIKNPSLSISNFKAINSSLNKNYSLIQLEKLTKERSLKNHIKFLRISYTMIIYYQNSKYCRNLKPLTFLKHRKGFCILFNILYKVRFRPLKNVIPPNYSRRNHFIVNLYRKWKIEKKFQWSLIKYHKRNIKHWYFHAKVKRLIRAHN